MKILAGILFLVMSGCVPAFASIEYNDATFKKTVTINGATTIGSSTGPAKLASGVVSASAVDLSSSEVTNTLTVGKGGTGQTSYTDGQLLIGNSSGNTLAKGTIASGTGISVTNGGGTISIASSGPTTSAISALDIDWSLLGFRGGIYTKTLAASGTVTFSNKASGECVEVRITNTALNYTLTWPTVKWHSATAPTQTAGATSDFYSFCYDGTDVYGNVVQDMH